MCISFKPLFSIYYSDRDDYKTDYIVKMDREYSTEDGGLISDMLWVSAYGIFFASRDEYEFYVVEIEDMEDDVWNGLYDACVARHDEFADHTERFEDGEYIDGI